MDDFTDGFLVGQNGNGNNGTFGGDGYWLIILFALIFGWGNGGNGGFGGRNSGVSDNYVLASDFATIQRQLSDGFGGVEKGLDTIRNGLCDGFYTEAQLVNGVNMNIAQNGYESRLATQNLGSQLASCCCDIREGIQANTTQGVMNTNALSKQISDCCCATEKDFMQNRFDMAQYNCSTLQAIDKVGDRIIDYLSADKAQALRDENQALRLAASQSAQNNYLINQLRPSPIPSFNVPSPYQFGINSGCGCGCGCA